MENIQLVELVKAIMLLSTKFYIGVSVVLFSCIAYNNDFVEATIIDRLNKIVNATVDIRKSMRLVGEQFERNIETKGDTELVGHHNTNNHNYLEKNSNSIGSIFEMIQTVEFHISKRYDYATKFFNFFHFRF